MGSLRKVFSRSVERYSQDKESKMQESKMQASQIDKMSKMQSAGLNPLSQEQISYAEKNTSAQQFKKIGLLPEGPTRNIRDQGIDKDLESRYQKIVTAPQYSESSDAFKAQMALRKARQASRRLGG